MGVELNHPDLSAKIHPLSYNTETGTSPSVVFDPHGTLVAGVAAAATNNNLGVAGVAPNAQIMSISNSMAATPGSRIARADGINFAWTNGAHIINNSWGSSVSYTVIDDAIADAVTLGRGGLGTVVVFSSGNDNAGVGYPATNSNVISVGATDNTDQRASFSNFGATLDVVAPGVDIYATDLQGTAGYNTASGVNGDYGMSSGTSFASPIVSGIAALILSMNPNLTQAQVRNIIESTTDKVAGYSYTIGGGENAPLSWNNQVGYGRVNAYKAVQRALGAPIVGPDNFCSTASYSLSGPTFGSANWVATGTGINSSTGVATMFYDGFGEVFAQLPTGCGTVTLSKKISTGVPNPAYIFAEASWIGSGLGYKLSSSGNTQVEAGYAYDPIGAGLIVEYQWNITDHTNWFVTPLTTTSVELNYWALPNPTSQKVYIRARNSCGWGGYQETTWEVGSFFARYSVSPNPTTDKVTILFEELKSAEGIPEYVELLNETSTLPVRSVKVTERDFDTIKNNGNKLSIDAHDLPRGVYYLHVNYGTRQKQRTHRVVLK